MSSQNISRHPITVANWIIVVFTFVQDSVSLEVGTTKWTPTASAQCDCCATCDRVSPRPWLWSALLWLGCKGSSGHLASRRNSPVSSVTSESFRLAARIRVSSFVRISSTASECARDSINEICVVVVVGATSVQC